MRLVLLTIALCALVASHPEVENVNALNENSNWFLSDSPGEDKLPVLDDEYKDAVEGLMEKYKAVPKRLFNLRDPEIRQQTMDIFAVLYPMKTFKAIEDAAQHLRRIFDEEQLTYVLAVLITHKSETHLTLPNWYEIHPNYFVPQAVLKQLNESKKEAPIDLPEGKTDGLDYFREDVGLNNFYYNWLLHWPSWMDSSSYVFPDWDRRGELFYYFHELLLGRYNLERISLDLRPIITTSWSEEIESFEPGLMDSHGMEMSSRPAGIALTTLPGGEKLVNIDNKVSRIAKDGIIIRKDGSSISMDELGHKAVAALSDIMYNASDSYNPTYYGSFYHQAISLLASAGSKDNTESGAIGNPMSAMRDPAFYRLLNRIVSIVQTHKKNLPPYTKKELSCDGVNIEKFKANDVETFFDYFEFDVGRLLGPAEPQGTYLVRQKRLNHTPLRVTLSVINSNPEEIGVMVRLFIGPFHHIKGITFEMSRTMFVELDRFPIKLNVGKNVIERDEKDFTNIVDESGDKVRSRQCGLPKRLSVPRGTADGIMYMLYVMISPYSFDNALTGEGQEASSNYVSCGRGRYDDGKAMGFPFDRPVRSYRDWLGDNHETTNLTIHYRSS